MSSLLDAVHTAEDALRQCVPALVKRKQRLVANQAVEELALKAKSHVSVDIQVRLRQRFVGNCKAHYQVKVANEPWSMGCQSQSYHAALGRLLERLHLYDGRSVIINSIKTVPFEPEEDSVED